MELTKEQRIRVEQSISLRHETIEEQKQRLCPVRNNNCEVLDCMWYDEEEQDCCIKRISQSLRDLYEVSIGLDYDD